MFALEMLCNLSGFYFVLLKVISNELATIYHQSSSGIDRNPLRAPLAVGVSQGQKMSLWRSYMYIIDSRIAAWEAVNIESVQITMP